MDDYNTGEEYWITDLKGEMDLLIYYLAGEKLDYNRDKEGELSIIIL